ncbi:YifB family Mg chelatase-like AAA ATPase [Parvularcula maris]|uniref:YifB family Mg chelatase-like AAA ATPase n=1 Tax=Parvularcula maris TaxID=2965077 RepID=A0A9X2LD55_9PROT|nr:YifB family Mg chelatase-like AAA ATPase [Parvularcula maris]MCQ8186367.1 YifB family Mg chelatase-like AAA ATPase [Parvularcula maris]
MVAEVTSFAFEGVEAREVTVQAHLTGGQPGFVIVGLPDKSVSEAKDRISAAFSAIGLGLPPKKITVNLAPADLRKEGSHFDLPIALALMAEMGAIPRDAVGGMAVIGELGLDGSIAKTVGALPAAMAANALDLGLICSDKSGAEAAWAGESVPLIAAPSIISLANHFKGTQTLPAPKPGAVLTETGVPDLSEVKGQETARRALEVAAAGGHNLLMTGPPGSGKSMMAERLPGLLPPLSLTEMLEVSMVQSVAGLIENGALRRTRPYRAPHHSASMAAMVGGGIRAKPGEASLAHRGVLFLDELPEFSPAVLDSLRQPLETGDILIARANAHVRYPARFQLVAAMNPCRCGSVCIRGKGCGAKYRARVSGPFLDRMDISVDTPPVSALDLTSAAEGESTAAVAARVAAARAAQEERGAINAALGQQQLGEVASLDEAGLGLLRRACEQLKLSARGYTRILRVARTLADLEGRDSVGRVHIAEAISFRSAEPAAEKAMG